MAITNGSTTIALEYPFPDERVFRYQAMQDVLSVLIEEPLEAYTVSELAELVGANQGTVSKAVGLLDDLEVVQSRRDGRKQYVCIERARLDNPDPILSIPQSEFHKPIAAFVDRVQTRIDGLVGIVAFGSVARGDADRASDIDLLVVVDDERTNARQAVQSIVNDLEETKFDGNRYAFQALVESAASARRIGERLREQFDEGRTLVGSDELTAIRREVYTGAE